MRNVESASALARSCGGTTFTIAEFTGPVDAKTRISEITIAVMYTGFDGLVNATNAIGPAISVATPQTHKYDCFVFFSSASAIHPPANVPTNPVINTIPPNVTVASCRGSLRTRSRNDGVQTPSPPSANVHAAYPRHVSMY